MPFSSFITIIHGFIIIISIGFSLIYTNLTLDSNKIVYLVSVLSVILFLWQMWSWKRITNEAFSPYLLFMLASMLFNSGQAFLIVLGLEDTYLNGSFSDEVIIKTVYIVTLGHSFLHFGALIAWITTKKNKDKNRNKVDEFKHNKAISIVGWGMFLISILPTLIHFKNSVRTVMTSGYFGIYKQDVVVGFAASSNVLADFIIPAVLFLLASSKNSVGKIKRLNIIVATITILLYVLTGFFIGSRSGPVLPLLAFAWVWHKCVNPIPKTFLFVTGSLFLFIIFPVIALLRDVSGEGRLSLTNIWKTFISMDNPLVQILNEMGSSMSTVAHTMVLVPLVRTYDLGIGYIYALFTAVPNLFWDIHPAIEHGKFANWLIWEVDPFIAKIGGGIGFSYIAEAYANFGLIGVPVVMLLFGFILVKLFIWAELNEDNAKIAMVASFLSFLLFIVRDESASIVRPLLWYATVPYLGVLILKKLISYPTKSLNK